MTIDVILPVRANVPGRIGELDRVTRGLLPSLIRSGYHTFTASFFVICPASDLGEIQGVLSKFSQFTFTFLTDETLLPECGFDEAAQQAIPGWHRQQILKLAAMSRSKAQLALVLDADVVAVNPISADALRSGPVPYQQMGTTQFRRWFDTSARALGVEFSMFTELQLKNVMGVTPEFLSPSVTRGLIARLESLATPEAWGTYLMSFVGDFDNTWTEYSMYWLYYLTLDKPDPQYKTYRLYRFIEDTDKLDTFLADTPQPFAVLQSTKLTTDQCQRVYDLFKIDT